MCLSNHEVPVDLAKFSKTQSEAPVGGRPSFSLVKCPAEGGEHKQRTRGRTLLLGCWRLG